MAGSATIGALRVNLGLDTAEFQDGIRRTQTDVGKVGETIKTVMIGMAAGITAALAGLAVSIGSTLRAVDDIAKHAQLANTSVENFQRLAYAARSVGFEGDKLSDIYKDVNDKFGEFNQTGSGALKDFFTNIAPKVNLTADAFKKLSGPDALQLYYDSLKKAGANQQQMTFYMEALANDATALIPLLENGGEGFRKLGAGASVLTEETVNRFRSFNIAMRDFGQAISDVFLVAVEALAPAISVVSLGFQKMSEGLRALREYLPGIMQDLAIAAGTLAVLFSPAIVAAVGGLTVAIGTGLVGAVRLLGAVILANPLTAIAAGITVASVAIFRFRDEIQQAIGVDVVQTVKTAGNQIISAFVASYERIKFYWSSFPDLIGAATIGATNAVIRGVNSMVNSIKSAVNEVASAVNQIPGVSIPMLDTNGRTIDELPNTYAENLAKAAGDFAEKRNEIYSTNWIGELGDAWKSATAPVLGFGNALTGVNKELAAGAAKEKEGGGKTDEENYQDIIDKANRRIAVLTAEKQAVGLSAEAAAELRYQTDLLNMAQQRGLELTSGQRAELSGLAQTMASIEAATDKLREAFDFTKETTKGFFSDLRQGLLNGESVWKSFGNAVSNVVDKIADRLSSQLIDSFFTKDSGGGSVFGNLFSGIFKGIPGFATGGTILPGGSGGVDSQLVMFRKSPNERVDITQPGQTLTRGGSEQGSSTLQVSLSPDLEARILERSGNQSIQIVRENNIAQQNFRQNGGTF